MVQMYYVNTDEGRASLLAHLRQIDVLSPAWYDANADGGITGYARRDVIDAAHAGGGALIPVVVNKDVDPHVGHAILADPPRRAPPPPKPFKEGENHRLARLQLGLRQDPWAG